MTGEDQVVEPSNQPEQSAADKADRLTEEEDAVLRRLHWFEQFGVELTPRVEDLKTSIRERDKRLEIRDPPDVVVQEPVYDDPDDPYVPVVRDS